MEAKKLIAKGSPCVVPSVDFNSFSLVMITTIIIIIILMLLISRLID